MFAVLRSQLYCSFHRSLLTAIPAFSVSILRLRAYNGVYQTRLGRDAFARWIYNDLVLCLDVCRQVTQSEESLLAVEGEGIGRL